MVRALLQLRTALLLLAIGSGLAAAGPGTREEWWTSESLPSPIERPAPVYPDSARKAGLEGRVRVRALVTETGAVDTVVAETGPAMFWASAVEAASRWRFQPPTSGGKPMRVWVRIPFEFSLGEAGAKARARAALRELRAFLLHAGDVRIHRLAPPTKLGDSSGARGKAIAEFTALESHHIRESRMREAWVELLCDSTSFERNISPGYVVARPAWALTFENHGRRVLALIRDPELTAQVRDGSRTWNGSLDARRDDLRRAIAVSFPRRTTARSEKQGAPASP